jgi:mevalonate kinase
VQDGVNILLSDEELSQLNLEEFNNLKTKLTQNLKDSYQAVSNFERRMMATEISRCESISNILSEASKTLKKLNFILHQEIDALLDVCYN